MIDGCVFDLDGVLVDSEPVWEQVRRQLVEERHGRWPPDAQSRLMGMSTAEWAQYLSEDLAKLTRAMRRGDGETLFDHFTRTRAIRRGIVQIGQDSAAADFGRPHPAKALGELPRPYAADSE